MPAGSADEGDNPAAGWWVKWTTPGPTSGWKLQLPSSAQFLWE
jgi:hypothetical protein